MTHENRLHTTAYDSIVKVYPLCNLPLTILPQTHGLSALAAQHPDHLPLCNIYFAEMGLGCSIIMTAVFQGRFPAFQGSSSDLCCSAAVVIMQWHIWQQLLYKILMFRKRKLAELRHVKVRNMSQCKSERRAADTALQSNHAATVSPPHTVQPRLISWILLSLSGLTPTYPLPLTILNSFQTTDSQSCLWTSPTLHILCLLVLC